MRYLNQIVFIVLLTLLPSVSVLSKVNAKELRLVTGEYPPYTSNEIPGGGYVSEIIKKVFSIMEYDLTLDYLPWKRGYVLTKQKEYVASYPYLKTEERSLEFLYSEPIVEWESKVYVREDSGIDYKSPLDLAGLTECIPHHFGSLEIFSKMHAAGSIKRVRPPYIKSCWLMVLNGRADFFIEDVFVAEIYRREILDDRFGEIIELSKTVSIDSGYIIFPRNSFRSEMLVSQFNQTLRGLKNRKEIAILKEEFIIKNAGIIEQLN
ncbi:substrate-binding periplasmic protein [Kiloniella antarctica]|uniref:Substrate-binding periplasmic protein n=1 Tax=Kiloniella antarctica TaxID=1550907 RepID=A0ABW5BHM0_9PROT